MSIHDFFKQFCAQLVLNNHFLFARQCLNSREQVITKTRQYNFDPLKPHFYIVKLGFTGVNIIFLISAQNTDCGYSLEPPQRGGSNEYPQSMFWGEIWKISEVFLSENFHFLVVNFSVFLNRRVFVMWRHVLRNNNKDSGSQGGTIVFFFFFFFFFFSTTLVYVYVIIIKWEKGLISLAIYSALKLIYCWPER